MMESISEEPPSRARFALKGDAKIITDFFSYSVQSILYQRKLYPSTDFNTVRKYGLNMMECMNDDVVNYISRISKQIRGWIVSSDIEAIDLDIISKDTGHTVEVWNFYIDKDKSSQGKLSYSDLSNKSRPQIQAIIRQISASVAFLPELGSGYTFNILVYSNSDTKVPNDWRESSQKKVEGRKVEKVRFKNLSIDKCNVSTTVTYKIDE